MAGEGKKGYHSGKEQGKRHQGKKSEGASRTITGASNGNIRRLARRAGIKRMSAEIYDEARTELIRFLNAILKDAIIYTQTANRQTLLPSDVIYALKRHGKFIYGLGV